MMFLPEPIWGGKNNKKPSVFIVPDLTGLAPGIGGFK